MLPFYDDVSVIRETLAKHHELLCERMRPAPDPSFMIDEVLCELDREWLALALAFGLGTSIALVLLIRQLAKIRRGFHEK